MTEITPNDDASRPSVPGFSLIRMIGEGGFGKVWLARNRATKRLRAVKIIELRRRGAIDPAGREITSIGRLESNLQSEHPNLLTIHHVGKTSDHLFYVMDLADDASGRPGTNACESASDTDYRPATLHSRLERGSLTPQECFDYARQLLGGLASLHEAGMVHRDVKPANCLFLEGELKLADFGLLTEADPGTSRVGTARYMPPDGRMDIRADVYAAGLVIYEMITGLSVESFPRLGDKSRAIIKDDLLGRLNRIVLGACQPEPEHRFADAGQMLGELDQSRPRPAGRGGRFGRWWLVGAVALAVAVGIIRAAFPPIAVSDPTVEVNFISDPFGATIFLDETRLSTSAGAPYRTPCTVPNVPPQTRRVVFRHADRDDLDAGPIDFGVVREVEANWH